MDYKESKVNKVDMKDTEDCRFKKTNDKKMDFNMFHTKMFTNNGEQFLKLTASNVFSNSYVKKISELDKYGEKLLLC